MTKRPTPAQTEILRQAAARQDGNVQMFTKTDSQGQGLISRGLAERVDGSVHGFYVRITQAGRDFVAGL